MQSEIDGPGETDLLKQCISQLKAENNKIKAENVKFKTRVAKLEQSQNNTVLFTMHHPMFLPISVCARPSNSKSLEDIETDDFLDSESKNQINHMMRKRNQ